MQWAAFTTHLFQQQSAKSFLLYTQVAAVRSAAEAAGAALVASLSPFAIDMILPVLLQSLDLKVLWQSKVAAMSLLVALSKQAPDAVKFNLPTIVPVLSYCVSDAKRQVKVGSIV